MTIPSSNSIISTLLQPTVSDLRERMGNVSEEAVTGRRSDLTLHLGGQIGKAMLSQRALDDLTQQRTFLNLRETRLEAMQTQLALVQEASSGIGVEVTSALGSGDDRALDYAARDAESALTQIFASLNTQLGDRFLFSGDATATPTLGSSEQLIEDVRQIALTAIDEADFAANIDAYFNDPAGGWQQNIYQGSTQVSDPDAITAIDPAITELISGLAVASLAKIDAAIPLFDTSSAPLEAASVRLLSGQTSLIERRGDLGLIQERISDQLSSLDVEETLLTKAFSDIAARDQYEAASELALLETNLEAAYLLTSRIAGLSLLNYLR
ncbi:MAG: flagellar hook-associated family protein [Henriciella sp.]